MSCIRYANALHAVIIFIRNNYEAQQLIKEKSSSLCVGDCKADCVNAPKVRFIASCFPVSFTTYTPKLCEKSQEK